MSDQLVPAQTEVASTRFTWIELGDGKKYKCPWLGFGPTSAAIEDAFDEFQAGSTDRATARAAVRKLFLTVFGVYYSAELITRLLDADLIGREHVEQIAQVIFCNAAPTASEASS